MRAWRWGIGGLCALALLGCGNNPVPKPEPVQQRLALQSFNSCNDLESYIEDTAVLDMKSTLEQYKNGYYGWWGAPGMYGAEDARATNAGAAAPSTQSAGPSAYTTTNTQVAGVDEADFVKNDGTRIFVLTGNKLYANQSWPADQLHTAGKLDIEGWPREMFLDKDKNRVVVFSSIWEAYPLDQTYAGGCDAMYCGYWYSNTTKVTVVDVTDLANLKAVDEYYLPGNYDNARKVGSSVRMVISDNFRWPAQMKWAPDYSPTLYQDKAALAKAYDQLELDNEKLIRKQQLTDWLPYAKHKLADGTLVDLKYDCHDFAKTNAPTKLGLVTIGTLNLDNPGNGLGRTSIVAEPGQIFASAKSLYIASQHWWWWPAPGQVDYTYLHKFDISDPNKAVYVASGGVDGTIVDQFSMDEDSQGYFRIATNISKRVEDTQNPDNWWGRIETTNKVTVMGEKSGQLVQFGDTGELAPGERIYSSRFVEGKGFVVTYRQVDPLFTLDLTDPAHPKKIGELTLPGFSTYIHPVDATHLLTIGTQIDSTGTWSSRQVKLTMFDVSDLASPKAAFTQLVGSGWGWSDAEYDHHAFNYFPEKKLLAIPFWDYNPNNNTNYWDDFVSDLRVFGVDPQTGFTAKGAVSLKDIYITYQYYDWTWYWSPYVRRSVMADDFVYAISDAGIRVANVNSLSTPLATTTFDLYRVTK